LVAYLKFLAVLFTPQRGEVPEWFLIEFDKAEQREHLGQIAADIMKKPPFNSARRTEGPILIDEVAVQKLQKFGEV